jgi:hypothetical protein
MRHITAALILSLLFLPACTGLNTVLGATSGSVASVAPDTVNTAKKALTATHELHRATADFLTIAATTNLCHATCASQAKAYLDQSEAALVAADTAIKLGDAVGVEAKIATATTLIGQVQALVGKK